MVILYSFDSVSVVFDIIKSIVNIIIVIQIFYYIFKYDRTKNLEYAIWALLLLGVLGL